MSGGGAGGGGGGGTQEHIGRTNNNRPIGPYEAVCDRD